MPDDGEGSLRMTYAQLADARGISKASAERLVRNRKWPRQVGNDGVAIIFVPPGGASPGHPPGQQGGKQGGHDRPGYPAPVHLPDDRGDIGEVVRGAIELAVMPLREQLTIANQRADRAEQRADKAERHVHSEVERAEQQVASLQAELASARVVAEVAEYATAEVADLRRRLDAEVEERREQLNIANRRADAERTRAERAELRIAELMMPWWRRWFRS